ncbi:MAG TPA: tyrosine-type recombinase/integrase [Allosphingosinicella sp.]|jgi:integrase
MRPRDRRRHQLGRFWLYQRPDTGYWFICWLDSGGGGRARTRRKTTGLDGGEPDNPPEAAISALATHHFEFSAPRKLSRGESLVENIIADWLEHHVAGLAAPERYATSAVLWLKFFDRETKAGRLPPNVTVDSISPGVTRRFVEWRRGQGVGGHTISRDLAALRGSLSWAWKHDRLESVPFIADVPTDQKAAPRDRVLSFEELARILGACDGTPEREHVVRFIVVELGTAGRPEAVLQLTDANIDLARGLIDPNQPGKRHLRKRRAIVPMARHVRPWVEDVQGKLIKYRAPIAVRNQVPGGPTHFEKDTASIKTAWNAICREAKVEGATPKTLRHTMLTWLATCGVPKEERMALAGHAAQDTTSRNYEHLTPDYLRAAIREVDEFFRELTRHTRTHLRGGYDPMAPIVGIIEGGRAH